MKFLTKSALIASVMLLAACDPKSRFDNPVTPSGGFDAASGLSKSELAASDPTSAAYFTQFVGDRVIFDVDAYVLSADARAILDGQIGWLAENAGYGVIIEGHADERGTREYNLGLGDRRANAARDYMISKGLSAARIKTVSYGKERPEALCSAESCYGVNRRAVTTLVASF